MGPRQAPRTGGAWSILAGPALTSPRPIAWARPPQLRAGVAAMLGAEFEFRVSNSVAPIRPFSFLPKKLLTYERTGILGNAFRHRCPPSSRPVRLSTLRANRPRSLG